jgi:uncharacterized alkaline shock family protein YloU
MFLTYADAVNAQKKSGVSPADSSGVPIDLACIQQGRYFQSINQVLQNIHESVESDIDRPIALIQMFHKVLPQSSFLGKLR